MSHVFITDQLGREHIFLGKLGGRPSDDQATWLHMGINHLLEEGVLRVDSVRIVHDEEETVLAESGEHEQYWSSLREWLFRPLSSAIVTLNLLVCDANAGRPQSRLQRRIEHWAILAGQALTAIAFYQFFKFSAVYLLLRFVDGWRERIGEELSILAGGLLALPAMLSGAVGAVIGLWLLLSVVT